jgi:arylsulfatase A-like enzyme
MNIVLVTIDSLRADHVSAYGYSRETTPNLDILADDGISFDAYANANATRASFPSILTSTYPLAYGGHEYLSDRRTLVSECLQAEGYTTGAIHSNVWLSREFNYDRGFDRFYDAKSNPGMLARARTNLKTHANREGIFYRIAQRVYDAVEREAGVDIGQTYQNAEVTTDRALDWASSLVQPFFLWVHYMDVHHPYVPHGHHAGELGYSLGVTESEAIQLRRKMLERPEELDDAEFQTLIDLYDAEIRYTDAQVGRLVTGVRERFDDTAFVLTADHGEELADHGGYSHNPSMYDEVLEVPFIINGGSVESGVHSNSTVELLDTGPTILDLADVTGPDRWVGRSALDRHETDDSAAVLSEIGLDDGPKFSLRADGLKYIWDHRDGAEELYDLVEDPNEQNDISGTARETGQRELREQLEEHVARLQETNESLPSVRMDAETIRRLENLGYIE